MMNHLIFIVQPDAWIPPARQPTEATSNISMYPKYGGILLATEHPSINVSKQ